MERIPYKIKKTTPLIISEESDSVDLDGNKIQTLSAERFSHEVMQLITTGELDEALYQIGTNLKNEPNSPHLLNLKALALGLKGEHEKALLVFEKLNKLFPNNAEILYQQSCALVALKRDHEAIDILRKANDLEHNEPSIPFNLGIEIIKTGGDVNEAKLCLNTARLMGHPKASLVINELKISY